LRLFAPLFFSYSHLTGLRADEFRLAMHAGQLRDDKNEPCGQQGKKENLKKQQGIRKVENQNWNAAQNWKSQVENVNVIQTQKPRRPFRKIRGIAWSRDFFSYYIQS